VTPGTRRGLTLLVAGAVALLGFQVAERAQIAGELAAAQRVAADGEEVLAGEGEDARRLGIQHTDLLELTATYGGLLDARAAFVASIGRADEAFTSASGKIDTSAQRAGILALQQKVLVERLDASVVTDAAAAADTVTAAVATAVAEHERVPGPVAGGYDRVRAVLDRVGGAHVRLEEAAGACGGAAATACASPGVIRFTPGLATWSDGRLHWAMTHELAHVYQFTVWGELVASGGYSSLFGGNIELLANCMAAQRGHPSANVSCSGPQLQWAGAIWGGAVPG